jgi:hypothetical protein
MGSTSETLPAQLWNIQRSRQVRRVAADMAGTVKTLLSMSKTVLFIDRNFSPKDRGFRVALEAFLLALLDRNKKWQARLIEYHTGDRIAPSDFRDLCNGWLPSIIPSGMQMRLVRWRFHDLHNRYVLTDLGGIQFGQGLDQAGDTDQQEDVVSLLDKTVSEQFLQDFIGPTPKYTRDPTAVALTGTKIV